MVIRGYDYKFAYTVGAYLALEDMKITSDNTPNANIKRIVYSAVVMSKAYEDRQRLDNEDYDPNYLTLDVVNDLNLEDFKQLAKEVDEAFTEGNKTTVKSQPKKGVKKNLAVEK